MKLNSQQITKFIFWPLEIAVFLLILVNAYFIFNTNYDKSAFYSYGMILGLIAFTFFTIALTPGLLGRFGVRHKIITWLMTYRREFGKLMFLFAFAHYTTIKVFPMIEANQAPTFPLYQTMGFIAFTLAIPLFLTSNIWSQKKLGIWWKRIHALVYIMVWLIFLHVALVQGFTIISALIFLLAFAETMSLANYYLFRLNLDTIPSN